MMNHKPENNTVNQRFSDVKKNLDASKSYLIFETDSKRSKDSILAKDLPIYSFLESRGFSWQRINDKELDREYLIVQTNPGDEDHILGRLMACALPKDMVYYVYKANTP